MLAEGDPFTNLTKGKVISISHDKKGDLEMSTHDLPPNHQKAPKKAYAYIRVSISEENPENQKLALQEWAKANNYEIVKTFEDVGVSGAIPPWERPGFKSLLETIKEEPLPVIAYELSRLGRSFYETFRTIQELESLGAPVITISPKEEFLQNLDPQIRKLIIAILAWTAERERELLRQRTREGMKRAKMEGKHVGRPKVKINMRKVRELRAKGVSYRDIARILDVNYYTLLRRVKEEGA